MTNPAFVLRMKEAENHFLYAKVNELNLFDALKGKTNQHFRIMELAFDLGNYGQDRVGTQSVTETVQVRFNWNASCTPRKCRDYFVWLRMVRFRESRFPPSSAVPAVRRFRCTAPMMLPLMRR